MTYNDFKNKYNGKYVDFDGAYGSQCWDLAEQYITECLNLTASILAGCGNVSNMLKEPKRSQLLKYFDEVKVTEMNGGDLCIWESNHIAIFDHWDGKSNWYFSQNPNPSQVMKISMSGLHAFRKKSNNVPKEKILYLNISPEADFRSVYSDKQLSKKVGEIKPKKYNGLSYHIYEMQPNEVVKIKTSTFGSVYISSKSKYFCNISENRQFKNGD